MNDSDETLTEARLTALLGARADRIEVHPDLAGVHPSTADSAHQPRQASLWWIAAAAVLLIACGAALFASQFPRPDDTGAAVPLSGDLLEFAAPAPRQQLLVWMNPEATSVEVEAVAMALAELPAVERHTYIDRAATYKEFTAYYADKPEVVELVSPEMLPTYFRVDTTSPAEVAEPVVHLPGVKATETRHPRDD